MCMMLRDALSGDQLQLFMFRSRAEQKRISMLGDLVIESLVERHLQPQFSFWGSQSFPFRVSSFTAVVSRQIDVVTQEGADPASQSLRRADNRRRGERRKSTARTSNPATHRSAKIDEQPRQHRIWLDDWLSAAKQTCSGQPDCPSGSA